MRIALDAMGGDHAPNEVVAGAIEASETGILPPGSIVLVGDRARVQACLDEAGRPYQVVEDLLQDLPPADGDRFAVVHASQVVGMDEPPAQVLRQKRDSSMAVATALVKQGIADGIVSAGNTGAMVAFAFLQLKSLEGVRRPGIAVTIEGEDGPFVVIDVGANIAPKPTHLLHYGVMGSTLARDKYGKANPRVGLLNIGGEEGKGNELAKEAQELFRASGLNFHGNIEGQDVFLGVCDVIVTEGFVGNVLLKLSEGLATHLLHVVQEELVRAGVRQNVLEESLAAIVRRTDFSEYGGALLLGIEGIVTIAHGRSKGRAIRNALRVSVETVTLGINEKIVQEIRKLEALA
ncbi:MAG: phosphate acyltransferase PlsX [Planctomycetota bacterium]